MDPDQAFTELVAQHAALRRLIQRCEDLADELDTSGGDALPLVREVARLRIACSEHDRFEEDVLRPLLATGFCGHVFADHVREHAELRTRLCTERTAMLRDVIASLRTHLDDEERYLRSAQQLVQIPRIMPPSTSRH